MQIKVHHIHMIGIGGAGMSGIAEVLLSLGYTVTGSDLAENTAVRRLQELGATIYPGHAREYVGSAEVVVKSSAVAEDNPELQQAQDMGIPIIPRAEMLAELMRLKTGIAVGGTHGKTTTTSFLGTIFKEAGLDPTVIIGGRLNSYGSNAFLGQGEFLIAEADESDGTFLCLLPIMTVVTNVDADHMDFYADQAAIDESFVRFMNQVPFYGLNVVCGDDPGVQRLLPRIKRALVTYGLEPDNDVRAEILGFNGGSHFRIIYRGRAIGEVRLKHPGRHNVLNALAAAALALEAGVSESAVIHGLDCFGGVGRRFEVKGENQGVLVVDDYGHHPTEITATLTTARETYPERRLVVIFQPHRFTRTQALFGQFCRAFEEADLVLLTEIYPASETPIPGVSGANLAQGIRQVSQTRVEFFEDFQAVEAVLSQTLQPGDLLLTLGAGSVWKLGETFLHSE